MSDNLSDRNDLLKKITDKHNKEMNNKENTDFLYSEESLDLAFNEVQNIKQILIKFVSDLNENAPSYAIHFRENRFHIGDLVFNLETMLVQFNQQHGNMAKESYLLFATVNGLYDLNGQADPFHPPTTKELMRLDFSKNNNGELGWRDRENKDKFYSSEEIVNIWLDKFFSKIK